jgi:hypothetical protein
MIPSQHRFVATLCALALLAAACTADTSDVEAEQGDFAGAALLARLQLSATHTIEFFDRGDDYGEVIESASMDADGETTVGSETKIEHGHYADAYRKLAGDQLDPRALARLVAFDQQAAERAAHAPAEQEGAVSEAFARLESSPEVLGGSVEKDLASDVDWFRNTFCNGCNGNDGVRQQTVPASWPACTTAPEVCWWNFQESTYQRRSKNVRAHAMNYSPSTSATFGIYYTDRCENSGWWERNFGDCRWSGLQAGFGSVAPRTAVAFTSTSGSSWTRRYEVRGVSAVGLMVDVY